MPAETVTNRIPLAEAARRERAKGQAALAQRLAERQAEYAERAPKQVAGVSAKVLGAFGMQPFEGATWTATGGPTDPWDSSGHYYSAETEVDGLRFQGVSTSDFEGRYERLYLLTRCPNDQHEPADRRVEVNSLAHLADLLEADLSRAGDCAACYFHREERGDPDVQPPPPPSAEERLVEAIETLIETRIGQRLDGFLATYLPDRI